MTRSDNRRKCVNAVISILNEYQFEMFLPSEVKDILPYGFYSRLIRENVIVREDIGWSLSSTALLWLQRNLPHAKDDAVIDSKKKSE